MSKYYLQSDRDAVEDMIEEHIAERPEESLVARLNGGPEVILYTPRKKTNGNTHDAN